MFRIIRVPPSLDQFFRPLKGHVHWDHFPDCRLLVVAIAVMGGRRPVAPMDRQLATAHHRTRVNNFFLVERWDPEAALRQKAQALLRSLGPGQGATISLVIDDSKHAKRGQSMDAVAKRKDPVTDAYSRGHQYGCAIRIGRPQVMPRGIRLDVKPEQAKALGLPFRKTTALAAQRSREVTAPAGVKVVMLFDASSRCRTVVQVGQARHFPVAFPLTGNRCLFEQGWKLKAGRQGRNLGRRRRTDTLVIAKPHGKARYRVVDAGWREIGKLGRLPVVGSRQGSATKLLGLVTDHPALSAAQLLQTYDRRWTIAPWRQDLTQLWGLGHYQNRPARAAVIHRHLGCFASALRTHRRVERHGAQGHRTRHKAAAWSTAAARDQLRGLIWDDWVAQRKDKPQDESVLPDLERLRIACNE